MIPKEVIDELDALIESLEDTVERTTKLSDGLFGSGAIEQGNDAFQAAAYARNAMEKLRTVKEDL